MMADELPKPISEEFRKVYDQHSLGQPLEESLKDMSSRVDSTDFSFFVTAVLIQRQTGGDLSEVLGNISRLVRSRMRLSQSVAAKTAEGRFTGYILICFPVVMFLICWYLNPELYGGFAAAHQYGQDGSSVSPADWFCSDCSASGRLRRYECDE